jgi:hypothetical protein
MPGFLFGIRGRRGGGYGFSDLQLHIELDASHRPGMTISWQRQQTGEGRIALFDPGTQYCARTSLTERHVDSKSQTSDVIEHNKTPLTRRKMQGP